jgi:hypothetical protein
MLYLSQRKISQITRMQSTDTNIDGQRGGSSAVANQLGQQQQQPQPQQQQQQPQQQQQQQYPNFINIKPDADNIKSIEAEITEIEKEIKDNKEKCPFRLMTAVFLGFCSIAIGIGANMKYGPGEMSALESLAGKRGLDGIVNTDPLRGINFGFAVAGFVLPIVGTIFSLAMALYSRNEVKKGEKNNRLRYIAKEGFSLPKKIESDIHPNHVKLQEQVDKIGLTPPTEVCSGLAVKLAKAHYRETKSP